MTLDSQLSFTANITAATRSCRYMLHNIRRLRPLLTQKVAQVLVQALVISRLDFCKSLMAGLPVPSVLCSSSRMQQLGWSSTYLSSLTVLRSLHWLPVTARIRFKTLVLVYRDANGSSPVYIQDMVKPYTPARLLRFTSANGLAAPSLRAIHLKKLGGFKSWLPNGGISSLLTSSQQKNYTSSAAE